MLGQAGGDGRGGTERLVAYQGSANSHMSVDLLDVVGDLKMPGALEALDGVLTEIDGG